MGQLRNLILENLHVSMEAMMIDGQELATIGCESTNS